MSESSVLQLDDGSAKVLMGCLQVTALATSLPPDHLGADSLQQGLT